MLKSLLSFLEGLLIDCNIVQTEAESTVGHVNANFCVFYTKNLDLRKIMEAMCTVYAKMGTQFQHVLKQYTRQMITDGTRVS